MVNSKKSFVNIIANKLIFIYLAIFPLGQLIRIDVELLGLNFPLHLADIVAGLAAVMVIFRFVRTNPVFDKMLTFLLTAAFSLMFSLTLFSPVEVLGGSLYLIRLFAYGSLFLLACNISVKKLRTKITLYNSLIVVSLFVGIFGWIQYFWVPDLRFLKYIGWDDHLYRLTSTFFDPTFTGILLVFGFLSSYIKYLVAKDKRLLILLTFFLITIAFTYARSAYLALIAGVVASFYLKGKEDARFNKVKISGILVILGLFFLIPLLPRPSSEGVKLERLYSVHAKFENYAQTTEIIKKFPVFGVGLNNMCPARVRYLGDIGPKSHSCSGSDSSLLLIFATTGIVGLIIFAYIAMEIKKNLAGNMFGQSFIVCSASIFTHSLFVNSLFYPWVMGWMAILLALSLKKWKIKG